MCASVALPALARYPSLSGPGLSRVLAPASPSVRPAWLPRLPARRLGRTLSRAASLCALSRPGRRSSRLVHRRTRRPRLRPTGTGKTLIAQAALFEALHTGSVVYYTTPLIALTEQKFHEMQESAVRWGFKADDVGLVTGNRRVNPNARVLVVVAEILLNRLLHQEGFDFSHVSAVVMDEFHNFADQSAASSGN